jgi:hypothetical protein
MGRSRLTKFLYSFGSGVNLTHAQAKEQEITHPDINNLNISIARASHPHKGNFGVLPIEILQLIFSHLDFTALLKCRCVVCRIWTHCIPGTSAYLRKALFLPSATGTIPDEHRLVMMYVELHTQCENFPCTSDAKAFYVRKIHKLAASYTTPAGNTMMLHPFVERLEKYAVAQVPGALRDYLVSLKNKAGALLQPDEHNLWRAMYATSTPAIGLKIIFR